ncbi:hypothetical protein FAGAP_1421 [Fusarium agapanthi]|uniref:Uncharacterized protein n=1 Tax=Fusarium agapanthi TaxID=1803897 RepID=A0A9P5BL29_9HYPO|nr:hypothetical protein FAGAP_1421 [Fusarium agapanthi]
MNTTHSTKVKQTPAMQSLDGLGFIHVLHGYRVCYPIFWDVDRDSFTKQDEVSGLQQAPAKLEAFNHDAESSNGWSVDQKLWGIGVAIALIKDILSSPDFPEAFRLAQEDAESWVEHDSLLKPGMKVAPYMSVMQDPRLRRQALATYFLLFQFNMPKIPEHLLKCICTLKQSALVEGPEEKEADSKKGTERGTGDELVDSLCKVKID